MRILAVATLLLLVSASAFTFLTFHTPSNETPSGILDPSHATRTWNQTFDEQGILDSDRDGAPDSVENFVTGSAPDQWNTSSTRIPDGWLIVHGLDVLDPTAETKAAAEPPADALSDAYQNGWPKRYVATLWEIYSWSRPENWNESEDGPFDNGLDPNQWDNNGDGIPDGWALYYDLDPLNSTLRDQVLPGGDGMSVWESFRHDTHPRLADTDSDGILDKEEIMGPLNPAAGGTEPARFPPSDPRHYSTTGSSVCDGYLVAHGLDPSVSRNAYSDLVHSGATTQQKAAWSLARFGQAACTDGAGLDPTVQSTRGGPIPDGWLMHHGLDPLEDGIFTKMTSSSADHDGADIATTAPDLPPLVEVTLSVLDEYRYGLPLTWDETTMGPWWGGTDPGTTDTDMDGLPDAVEMRGYYISIATETGPDALVTYQPAQSDPTKGDTDMDGLADYEEITIHGTDALRRDTDADQIPDNREVFLELGLDPTRADSAKDHLRDGVRLAMLEERSTRYLDDPIYEHQYPTGPFGTLRKVTDWAVHLPGTTTPGDPLAPEQLSGLFAPQGDADGDGVPNIVDADMDSDGLLNGWESDPALYVYSEYGAGAFSRSASDPLNPDTDGDTLRDGWEVLHGEPVTCPLLCPSGYDLDPARWDSLRDGVPDADQDLDDDGLEWMAFKKKFGGQIVADLVEVGFDNGLEQQHESDPHMESSSGDGLSDGWKVFWGEDYPGRIGDPSLGLYFPRDAQGNLFIPGTAVRPQLGIDQSDVTLTDPVEDVYNRFILDINKKTDHESLVGTSIVKDGNNQDRVVYRVRGAVRYGFTEVQEMGTNPYMEDSTGDGIPDWWVYQYSRPQPAGTPTDAGCVADVFLDPRKHYPEDFALETGSGLSLIEEYTQGTDPLCRDTDLDGLSDGEEVGYRLDPLDPTDAQDITSTGDRDWDGLEDTQEILGLGGLVRTDPDHPDMDGDGLLDGHNVVGQNATHVAWFLALGIAYERNPGTDTYTFLGELDQGTSPRRDDGEFAASGWLIAHARPLAEASSLAAHYSARMPTWWDDGMHGPWWGGGDPDQQTAPAGNDLDVDGLMDVDGEGLPFEDPLPFANHGNTHTWASIPWDPVFVTPLKALGIEAPAPSASPWDDTLPDLVRRALAQAYLDPAEETSYFRRFDPDAASPPPTLTPCIKNLAFFDNNGDPTHVIVKGIPVFLHGRITDCQGVGLHGVTVEAQMGEPLQSYGAAFTDAAGNFVMEVRLSAEHGVTLRDDVPVVLRGRTSGDVAWVADPSRVAPGSTSVLVRTYASATQPGYRDALDRAFEPIDGIVVKATGRLMLDAPDVVLGGTQFKVKFQLLDSGGSPFEDATVRFTWDGVDHDAPVDDGGRGSLNLPTSKLQAGHNILAAHSIHSAGVREFVTAATNSTSIQVRNPADIVLSTPSAHADAGQSIQVRGQMTDLATGAGLDGVDITLNLTNALGPVQGIKTQTDAGGRFEEFYAVPKGLHGGPYDLVAQAQATDFSVGVISSVPVTIRSLPVFTQVTTSDLLQADPVTVAGLLLEPGGSPMADAVVHIRLHNEETQVSTDETGSFQVSLDPALPIGPVIQALHVQETPSNAEAVHLVERFVISTTQFNMSSGLLARGAPLDLPISLTTTAGMGVPGARVEITWGDEPPVHLFTDEDGNAVYHRPGNSSEPLGPVVVRADYTGSLDGGFDGAEAAAVWTVAARAEILLPEGTFEAGEAIPFGTLRDAGTGKALTGQEVLVDLAEEATLQAVDGGDDIEAFIIRRSGTEETDVDGRFQVMEPVDRSTPPTDLLVLASYAGDDVYDPVVASANLSIRTPVRVAVNAPSIVVMGQETLATVFVQGLDGHAAPDGKIELSLHGVILASGPIENGKARVWFTVPAGEAPGSQDLRFTYVGSSTLAPGSAEAPIQLKRPVQLTITADWAAAGETTYVYVEAKSGGSPIPFAEVYLQVAGRDGGMIGRTDEKGVATFRVEQPGEPTLIAARFAGDPLLGTAFQSNALSPAPPVSPVQAASGWLVWIASVAAVVLSALAWTVYRLRRNPLEPVFRRMRGILVADGPHQQRIYHAYLTLEDAAMGHGLIDEVSRTPRVLEQAILSSIPADAHAALDALVSLFEIARYSTKEIGPEHSDEAVSSLKVILGKMRAEAGLTWGTLIRRPTGATA